MGLQTEQRQQQPHVACTSCGRKFRYPLEFAGRTARCACGSAILIPMPHDPGEADEYDLAPEPTPKPAAAAAAHAGPAVGLSAGPGSADVAGAAAPPPPTT